MSELVVHGARRRADAERSITAILDAALAVLGDRPGASMNDVAVAAGVTRQTIYAHYPSRDVLLTAVAERARERALAAIDAADTGGDPPAETLQRVVATWWSQVVPHARVLEALATAYPTADAAHTLHAPILERLERLARRGQRAREFDRDVSPRWLASSFLALVHAAAEEVAGGRMTEAAAGKALTATVRKAFGVTPAAPAPPPATRAGARLGARSR